MIWSEGIGWPNHFIAFDQRCTLCTNRLVYPFKQEALLIGDLVIIYDILTGSDRHPWYFVVNLVGLSRNSTSFGGGSYGIRQVSTVRTFNLNICLLRDVSMYALLVHSEIISVALHDKYLVFLSLSKSNPRKLKLNNSDSTDMSEIFTEFLLNWECVKHFDPSRQQENPIWKARSIVFQTTKISRNIRKISSSFDHQFLNTKL
jgi:hypothetical protein